MSEIDPCVNTPLVDWSDLGVSGLLPILPLVAASISGRRRKGHHG
jgi:hypothetical protein